MAKQRSFEGHFKTPKSVLPTPSSIRAQNRVGVNLEKEELTLPVQPLPPDTSQFYCGLSRSVPSVALNGVHSL